LPTFVVGGGFDDSYILTGVNSCWDLSMVLICISFMARDGELFFHVFFGHLNFFF
jgi:hypothetical protein